MPGYPWGPGGSMTRATWFCVDIECSGPVPAIYDMVSLGAVPVRQLGGKLEIGDGFYVEICPVTGGVDAGAMAVNGLDYEALKRTGVEMSRALEGLNRWVDSLLIEGSKPVFVGHNAPFDWSFVSYSYHACGIKNPFGYKALDTKALAMGVLGLHWFDSHKERLDELLDLPPVEANKVHRADYDAWYQAHILVKLLERGGLCADS